MELDQKTIKAVSASARVKMLKTLTKRKKMPSELSKELGLSPSTVVGHLRNLENAGLVHRIDTGHKWVYYALTDKGSNIVQPRQPIQIALTLAGGVIITAFGFLRATSKGIFSQNAQKSAVSETLSETRPLASLPNTDAEGSAANMFVQNFAFDWISAILIMVGIAIIVFGIYYIRKRI